MCLTPDGKVVVMKLGDKTARVCSLEDGTLQRELTGHTRAVYSVCVMPDGKHVVTKSWDKTAMHPGCVLGCA